MGNCNLIMSILLIFLKKLLLFLSSEEKNINYKDLNMKIKDTHL